MKQVDIFGHFWFDSLIKVTNKSDRIEMNVKIHS